MRLGTWAFCLEVPVHGSFHLSFYFFLFSPLHLGGVAIPFRSFLCHIFVPGFPMFLFNTIVSNYLTALSAASFVGGQTGGLGEAVWDEVLYRFS